MPGELLAKIYGLYGPRLLEQNVRTFLQARTKVNRGIIETISQTPERWTPKFGQLAKVGSRPRKRSLACHGRDGVILLN